MLGVCVFVCVKLKGEKTVTPWACCFDLLKSHYGLILLPMQNMLRGICLAAVHRSGIFLSGLGHGGSRDRKRGWSVKKEWQERVLIRRLFSMRNHHS